MKTKTITAVILIAIMMLLTACQNSVTPNENHYEEKNRSYTCIQKKKPTLQ